MLAGLIGTVAIVVITAVVAGPWPAVAAAVCGVAAFPALVLMVSGETGRWQVVVVGFGLLHEARLLAFSLAVVGGAAILASAADDAIGFLRVVVGVTAGSYLYMFAEDVLTGGGWPEGVARRTRLIGASADPGALFEPLAHLTPQDFERSGVTGALWRVAEFVALTLVAAAVAVLVALLVAVWLPDVVAVLAVATVVIVLAVVMHRGTHAP